MGNLPFVPIRDRLSLALLLYWPLPATTTAAGLWPMIRTAFQKLSSQTIPEIAQWKGKAIAYAIFYPNINTHTHIHLY